MNQMLSMLASSSRRCRRRIFVPWQSLMRDWWREDAPTLIYLGKVVMACLLAMWLSLRFELEQPRTAMLTVVIVMQSRAGMVFAKSFYRLLGTTVGIVVSFLLVAMFAQERVLFLGAMAIWIGFCTAGSMMFRNHQSYGFVLAGYTICIVGLPATIDPQLTFDIGMTRISEILVGLFSATLVSDLIFPQRMWDVLLATVRRRFSDFSDLLCAFSIDSISGQHSGAASRAAALRFIGDIFDLESLKASAVMENDASRGHRLRLGRMNSEFMAVSTSFHTLEQLLRRQHRSSHPQVVDALLGVYRSMQEAIAIEGRSARTELEAAVIAGQLKHWKRTLGSRLDEVREPLKDALNANEWLDFETGAELMQRFADELLAYANTYASLAEGGHALHIEEAVEPPPSMDLYFDPVAVTLAGIRGALALGLMTSLWILADWRSGIEAITIGVVTSTLFASSPSPERTVKQFIIGGLLGTVLLYVFNFHLLPQAQGFLMLSLAVTPGIVIAAWITTRPAIATVGSGAFIIFFMHIGFNNAYSASPVGFMNDTIADFMAIAMSGSMYALIDLSNSRWSHQRLAAILRGLVVSACRGALPLRRARLESAARALMQRVKGGRRAADGRDQELVDWLLSTLEIGGGVIALREEMNGLVHAEAAQCLSGCLDAIAELYESPSSARRMNAIAETDQAVALLSSPAMVYGIGQSSRRSLLTTLHYLRTSLLDEGSALSQRAPLIHREET